MPDLGLGPFPSPAGEPARREATVTDRIYRGLASLQEAVGLTPVDDMILEYRLDDLWGYHDDDAFRDAARARLREALGRHGAGPLLLAAHSMGGLIAYDVLRLAERDGSVAGPVTLVTLGSPFGLAEVRLKLAAEHGDLAVPRSVTAWMNLMDRNDIATVGEDLADAFPPNEAGAHPRRAGDQRLPRPERAREHPQVLRLPAHPGILPHRGGVHGVEGPPAKSGGKAPIRCAGDCAPSRGRLYWRHPPFLA